MTANPSLRKSALFGSVLLLTGVGSALAQATDEQVTVDSPYTIHEQTQTNRWPSPKIRGVAISRRVSYGDLDLSKDWGRYLLQHRITEAAHDVCDEIDRRYWSAHVTFAAGGHCVRTAVRDAMAAAASSVAAVDTSRAMNVASLP